MNKTVLVIAGSDSSGGAGVQRDQRTLEQIGVRSIFAVTGLTAQVHNGVSHIQPASIRSLAAQLSAAAEHQIDAVKLGAVFSRSQIRTISSFLKKLPELKTVIDPVFAPTNGKTFLAKTNFTFYADDLFPYCDILCPNAEEAILAGSIKFDGIQDPLAACRILAREYGMHVFLKGGHLEQEGSLITEYLVHPDGSVSSLIKNRKQFIDAHGTGCTFSSAVAGHLALGLPAEQAAARATRLVSRIYSDQY